MKTNERNLPPYITLEKQVGETPLECLEDWRSEHQEAYGIPLAYAGRLDPMASGKLLILIGDECKVQEKYHGLDKEYEFSVLFGVGSDSHDVLGIIKENNLHEVAKEEINNLLPDFSGSITLPYPIFSSRTVKGKPLHTWTMEGRLDEISIPEKTSTVYQIRLIETKKMTRAEIFTVAQQKIDSLPTVTDSRKALGNDFRRPAVKKSWQIFLENGNRDDEFTLADFICIASSGTYMRSLAEAIGGKLKTEALAFSIHRTRIGHYDQLNNDWIKEF